jgi:protein SCO1/2
MKTLLALCLVALTAAGVVRYAGFPASPSAATPTCCVTTDVKLAAPFTTRSLYQLEAKWNNDAGQPVSLAALRGRPVVLTMFFAHCENACPILVSQMKALREKLPADARAKTKFVLVSFDSERDTSAALKAYREHMALDAGWTLLHGEPAEVQELAMLLGVKYKQDARGQFSHSNLITVLNVEGEVAHQRAGLEGDISELTQAVERVAKHNPPLR